MFFARLLAPCGEKGGRKDLARATQGRYQFAAAMLRFGAAQWNDRLTRS